MIWQTISSRLLTLAPIWLPHCPAWMWTISRILNQTKKITEHSKYTNTAQIFKLKNTPVNRCESYKNRNDETRPLWWRHTHFNSIGQFKSCRRNEAWRSLRNNGYLLSLLVIASQWVTARRTSLNGFTPSHLFSGFCSHKIYEALQIDARTKVMFNKIVTFMTVFKL